MKEIPQGLCELGTLKTGRLCKLHVGHKAAIRQHGVNSCSGILPGDYLCSSAVPRRRPVRKVQTVIGIPDRQFSGASIQPIAAAISPSQERGLFRHWLILGKLCGNYHACIVCIASETEQIVDVLIGKRKSEGLFIKALRLFDLCDLFCFCGKQT